jgi:adenylate cyclase
MNRMLLIIVIACTVLLGACSEMQIAGTVKQTGMQNEINEYSLMVGEQAISLGSWDTGVDLSLLLGEPVSESIEVLGSTADTYSGSYIKTLQYEGLTVQLFSPRDNGKEFWIMSMLLTNDKLKTPGGITVGSTLADLHRVYKDLAIIPDGRTDQDNCAYGFNRERYEYMEFEVEGGVVKEIKLYVELP